MDVIEEKLSNHILKAHEILQLNIGKSADEEPASFGQILRAVIEHEKTETLKKMYWEMETMNEWLKTIAYKDS